MEILELQLLAFGPFTDVRLDFAGGDQKLNILFGRNEAGKSAALRALTALLYGILHNTKDNFIHEHSKLRIGARLRHSDGSELRFLRRKGNKNTLLGPDEEPIGDASLDRFIRGVGQDLFTTVFGIDHDALIRGGESILRGGGDVAQSLFAAGLGGASLRQVLDELDTESNGLFLPGGKIPTINRLINEHREAKQAVKAASLRASDWAEHDGALREAK